MTNVETTPATSLTRDTLPLGALFCEDAPFPCFLIDISAHKIVWANDTALTWTGLSMKALTKKSTLWSVLDLKENAEDQIRETIKYNSAVTIRDCDINLLPQSSEETYICHLSAFPTQGHIGIGVRFVKHRNGSEHNAGGHVVSGLGRLIAHELKNPLAGIKGAAQLLRDDVSTDEGHDLIDLISSEIDRIRRLADRMETLGDTDPETNGHVNIHEILRRARQIIQSADKSIQFTEIYDPSLPHVLGDPDTLMQAVLNLIKNAAEAGDKVTLKTQFRSGMSRRRGDTHKNLPVEIQIIDNGPGITPDLIDQIFQPFVSTKADGQGLGLALVSKVAASHNGLVQVSSLPGKTKFSLLLPTPKTENDTNI